MPECKLMPKRNFNEFITNFENFRTALVFGIGVITLMGTCCYIGLVMAVTLHDCDPITAGIVARPDQILPYFIMKTVSHIPAMPGIFITGICSAAIG